MLQEVVPQESAEETRDEIRNLVSAGDLGRALRRLLDFARDFSPGRELENEAVSLSARMHLLSRETRKTGPSPDADAKQGVLVGNLLDLTDEIYSQTDQEKTPPLHVVRTEQDAPRALLAGSEALGPRPAVARIEPPESVTTTEESATTRLENARAQFRLHRQETASAPAPVFKCQRLSKSYRGREGFELADLDLELRPGEITGLIGVNGAGKTTVLRIVAGELRPSGGTVTYPQLVSQAKRSDWAAIRRQIAYVEQAPRHWYGRLAENLHLAAAVHGLHGKENDDEVEFILQRLGLDEFRDHTWNEISGGFKMRFELAKALVSQPRLLVLDEPLAPLDVLTQQLFLQDLCDLASSRRNPLPIIVSSQHLFEIEAIADQILFLDAGRPVYCGLLEELGKDRADNLFELSASVTRTVLEKRLQTLKILDIEEFGATFHVRVPRSTSGPEVLRAIVNAGIELDYFRDISRSTRRLFDSKLDSL